jgi:hypothetical protein
MPTIESVSIRFVKNQFAEGMVMEFTVLTSDGEVHEKTVPIDGRTIRLDYAFFRPAPDAGEVDGA